MLTAANSTSLAHGTIGWARVLTAAIAREIQFALIGGWKWIRKDLNVGLADLGFTGREKVSLMEKKK